MTIGIVRTEWSGTTGGPGLTQMAMAYQGGTSWTPSAAQSAVDAVRGFWASMTSSLPNELSLSVDPQVDMYDEVSGQLTQSLSVVTPPASVAGAATGSYAGGVGVRFNWNTGAIMNGRRVVGRTYVVPAAAGVFESNGTVLGTVITNLTGYGTTLLSNLAAANLALVVWSRPATTSSNDGAMTVVQTASVPDKSAILRGRRD